MTNDPFDRMARRLDEIRDEPWAETETLLLTLNSAVGTAMRDHAVSRSELADKLGVSRAYITKLLSGNENLTLKTLVRLANALEMKVDVRLRPREGAARTRRAAKPTATKPARTSRVAATKPRAVATRSRGGTRSAAAPARRSHAR